MLNIKPVMRHVIWLLLFVAQACTSELKIPESITNKPSAPTSLQALRRVKISDDLVFGKTEIRAIVTSDTEAKNFDSKELIIQDLTQETAILLRLDFDNTTIKMGDIILLNLENTKLIEQNGELMVNQVKAENITVESSGNTVTAKSTNIASIFTNAKYWGPLYVKIDKVNITNTQGDRLVGDVVLDDDIIEIRARFLPQSVFAVEENPLFVQVFKGVIRQDSQGWMLVPRNLNDIQIGLLELLEDFEATSSSNYDSKVLNFTTGPWSISGGITAATADDRKNGKQSIRLQGTVGNNNRQGIIAMNFDLKGVKTISVSHGIYPASAELNNVNPTVVALEMSKDGGQTYTRVGTAEIDTQYAGLKTTVFEVNNGFSEEARFRIVNISQQFSNNNRPRINIDDIFFTF